MIFFESFIVFEMEISMFLWGLFGGSLCFVHLTVYDVIAEINTKKKLKNWKCSDVSIQHELFKKLFKI